jgi:hypothetical protein
MHLFEIFEEHVNHLYPPDVTCGALPGTKQQINTVQY